MSRYKLAKKNGNLPALKDKYDPRTGYDWLSARTAFIEGWKESDGAIVWPTAAQISDKYDIPVQNVYNFISKEKWKAHREAHQREIAIERQREQSKRLANRAVKFDETSAAISEQTKEVIAIRLEQILRLRKMDNERIDILIKMIEDNDLEVSPSMRKELSPLVSAGEIESLMKGFALADEVGRKALGITETEDKGKINIEVTQTNNISEKMNQTDRAKIGGILDILSNNNIQLGELMVERQKEIEDKVKDVLDAEVIEEGSEDE